MNIDQVLIAGRITQPIELRYTASGSAVCDVAVAVNRRHRKADGSMKEEVVFFDIEVYGPAAEHAAKNLTVGKSVVVQGHHRIYSRPDATTGKTVNFLKIVGQHLHYDRPKSHE